MPSQKNSAKPSFQDHYKPSAGKQAPRGKAQGGFKSRGKESGVVNEKQNRGGSSFSRGLGKPSGFRPAHSNNTDAPQKSAYKQAPQREIDNGYEESGYANRQYGRPGNRGMQAGPGRSQQGGRPIRQRFGKSLPSQSGSPASRRFGPGSKPEFKSFNHPTAFKPASQTLVEEPAVQSFGIEDDLPQVNLLIGRNPIREAIKTGRDLEKLMIAKGELSGSAREIVSLAKKAGVMIQSVERSRLDQLAKNHQGMIAFASAYKYATVEEIMETAKQRGEAPFIVVLDQITDPHNLGAVIRTASCAGVHGVIVPQHRAVGLTPAAVKASAGAVEHIHVARVTNLNQTIKSLQKQGVWFYAAMTEGEDFRGVKFSGPCALVIGSEGEGVSQLTASLCDKQVKIPMKGEMNSLNASVAAGILMYAAFDSRTPMA